jgi:DnaK suppressor protein
MTHSDLINKLRQRREFLFEEITKADLNARNYSHGGDDADQAQRLNESSEREVFRSRAKTELDRIESALSRIQNGCYGECVDCGEQIGNKRLSVNPSATLCFHCQSNFEAQRVKSYD